MGLMGLSPFLVAKNKFMKGLNGLEPNLNFDVNNWNGINELEHILSCSVPEYA